MRTGIEVPRTHVKQIHQDLSTVSQEHFRTFTTEHIPPLHPFPSTQYILLICVCARDSWRCPGLVYEFKCNFLEALLLCTSSCTRTQLLLPIAKTARLLTSLTERAVAENAMSDQARAISPPKLRWQVQPISISQTCMMQSTNWFQPSGWAGMNWNPTQYQHMAKDVIDSSLLWELVLPLLFTFFFCYNFIARYMNQKRQNMKNEHKKGSNQILWSLKKEVLTIKGQLSEGKGWKLNGSWKQEDREWQSVPLSSNCRLVTA